MAKPFYAAVGPRVRKRPRETNIYMLSGYISAYIYIYTYYRIAAHHFDVTCARTCDLGSYTNSHVTGGIFARLWFYKAPFYIISAQAS